MSDSTGGHQPNSTGGHQHWLAPAIFLSLGALFGAIHLCVMRKLRRMKTGDDDEEGTSMSMIAHQSRYYDDETYDDGMDNVDDDNYAGVGADASGGYGATGDMPEV